MCMVKWTGHLKDVYGEMDRTLSRLRMQKIIQDLSGELRNTNTSTLSGDGFAFGVWRLELNRYCLYNAVF